MKKINNFQTRDIHGLLVPDSTLSAYEFNDHFVVCRTEAGWVVAHKEGFIIASGFGKRKEACVLANDIESLIDWDSVDFYSESLPSTLQPILEFLYPGNSDYFCRTYHKEYQSYVDKYEQIFGGSVPYTHLGQFDILYFDHITKPGNGESGLQAVERKYGWRGAEVVLWFLEHS